MTVHLGGDPVFSPQHQCRFSRLLRRATDIYMHNSRLASRAMPAHVPLCLSVHSLKKTQTSAKFRAVCSCGKSLRRCLWHVRGRPSQFHTQMCFSPHTYTGTVTGWSHWGPLWQGFSIFYSERKFKRHLFRFLYKEPIYTVKEYYK